MAAVRVALDRARELDELERRLAGRLRDLGDERRDDLLPDARVLVPFRLTAWVVARERLLDRLAGVAPNRLAVDPGRACRRKAVLAEAKAEKVSDPRAERDEVALVRVAVLEPQVVERLRGDPGDSERGDVGGEGAGVGAGVGIRRTQLGDVAVAERVLGRALGMCRCERAVVEEHRPCSDREPAPVGRGDRLGQDMGRLADRRLQALSRGAPAREGRRRHRSRGTALDGRGCAGRRPVPRGRRPPP